MVMRWNGRSASLQLNPAAMWRSPKLCFMDFNEMIQLLAQRLSSSRGQKTIGSKGTWEPFDPSVGYAHLQAMVGPEMNLNDYELADTARAHALITEQGRDAAVRYMQQNARRRSPAPEGPKLLRSRAFQHP